MRKILLASSFFPLSIFTLALSMVLLLTTEAENRLKTQASSKTSISEENSVEQVLESIPYATSDSAERVANVRSFLSRYHSPLEPYSHYIVEVSDTYGIDFRLIPAIAMQESNLCKKAPIDSHNCWGYGIYGGKVKHFSNFKEGIERVAFTLSQNYISKGFSTVEQIMTKYTPNNTNNWVAAVSHFMAQIDQ